METLRKWRAALSKSPAASAASPSRNRRARANPASRRRGRHRRRRHSVPRPWRGVRPSIPGRPAAVATRRPRGFRRTAPRTAHRRPPLVSRRPTGRGLPPPNTRRFGARRPRRHGWPRPSRLPGPGRIPLGRSAVAPAIRPALDSRQPVRAPPAGDGSGRRLHPSGSGAAAPRPGAGAPATRSGHPSRRPGWSAARSPQLPIARGRTAARRASSGLGRTAWPPAGPSTGPPTRPWPRRPAGVRSAPGLFAGGLRRRHRHRACARAGHPTRPARLPGRRRAGAPRRPPSRRRARLRSWGSPWRCAGRSRRLRPGAPPRAPFPRGAAGRPAPGWIWETGPPAPRSVRAPDPCAPASVRIRRASTARRLRGPPRVAAASPPASWRHRRA
jgi:hypothetical protein